MIERRKGCRESGPGFGELSTEPVEVHGVVPDAEWWDLSDDPSSGRCVACFDEPGVDEGLDAVAHGLDSSDAELATKLSNGRELGAYLKCRQHLVKEIVGDALTGGSFGGCHVQNYTKLVVHRERRWTCAVSSPFGVAQRPAETQEARHR